MSAQVVTFRCVLQDRLGKVISDSFSQDVITLPEPKEGALLPALAEGLQNLKPGEKRRIELSADRAYGFYDPTLVMEVARKRLDCTEAPQTGQEVMTRSNQGKMKLFRITRVGSSSVTLDGNHPLAGQDLVFDIEAFEVRDATSADFDMPSDTLPSNLH